MQRFRALSILALLVGLGAHACDRPESSPVAVEAPAPQFGNGNGNGNGNAGGNGSGSSIVWGEDGTGYAETVIGPEGGTLVAGEHRLTVPAGAVVDETLFTMELTGATTISVELTATALGSVHKNDVGRGGFRKTLHLDLSYDKARGYSLNELHIALQNPDGSLQRVPSHVHRAQKFVRGYLSHFSGYIIAD